jgi:hypothetical protein
MSRIGTRWMSGLTWAPRHEWNVVEKETRKEAGIGKKSCLEA